MIQGKNYIKNKKAVRTLKALGYPIANIRKAMHKLTGISQPEMARRIKKSRQNITLTISGDRTNSRLQKNIAEIWGVPAAELFEESMDNEKKQRQTGDGKRADDDADVRKEHERQDL